MNKIKKNFFLLVLLLLPQFTGCSKDYDSNKMNADLVDYTYELVDFEWNKMKFEQLYIIRSNSEYIQYSKDESTPLPNIDFSTYSLLTVKGLSDRGISEINRKIISKGTGEHILQIDITLNDATMMEEWHLGILISDILYEKKIESNITYIKD